MTEIRILHFALIFFIGYCGTLSAQTDVLTQAKQDLNKFESQYHTGANTAQLYETLYSAYKGFIQIAEKRPTDRNALAGLRKVYPYLIDGAVYFSSNNNNSRACDFAVAYIDLPTIPAFKMERFSRNNQYPQLCYMTANESYNSRHYDDAIKYYKLYIESGDQTYLNKSRLYLKNAYYNKINICTQNKDYVQAEKIVDEVLSLEPGNVKALTVKARFLEEKGDLKGAVQILEKLYKIKPKEESICQSYAFASFKYANELMNSNNSFQAKKHLETSAYIFGLLANNTSNQNTPKYKQGHNLSNDLLAKIGNGRQHNYAANNSINNGNEHSMHHTNNLGTKTYNHGQELISFSELPSYEEYAKKFVEEEYHAWQTKDDYETINEYNLRVNDESKEIKKKELIQTVQHRYISEFGTRISLDNLRLERYDAENGVFLITSPDFGNLLLPVPRTNNEARSFEEQWSTVKFENPRYCISNDKLALAQLSFRTNTGKCYVYNNEADLTYNNSLIEYKFDEVDVSSLIAENKDKTLGGAKIVTQNVTLGESDVDVDIPISKKKNNKLFAVILANEQYENESNVSFAHNDGLAFKNYCIKTLGAIEKNVHFVQDATLGNIRKEVRWIKQVADAFQGEAQIILYYAGHGVPDEASKSAYLLPTDGMATDIESGYKLDDLYASLGNLPTKNVTVFLDACFSGAQRTGAPMESKKDSRAPIIKAKASVPQGKMVVMSAATGDETAFPFKEQKHGMFTYFLLKKLKESKGEVSYGELADYITKNVKQNSLIENNKSQTPTTTSSTNITEKEWRAWKLKN